MKIMLGYKLTILILAIYVIMEFLDIIYSPGGIIARKNKGGKFYLFILKYKKIPFVSITIYLIYGLPVYFAFNANSNYHFFIGLFCAVVISVLLTKRKNKNS